MDVNGSDIKYNAKDDQITGYLAKPSNAGRYPGIILIHEIFGLNEHIKEVANRFAAEGYVVLAPHLFSSKKFSGILNQQSIMAAMKFMMSIPVEKQRDEKYRENELNKLDTKERDAVMEVYTTLFVNRPTELFTEYLSCAVDYLNSMDNVNGKIGSMGFCFGGGMSINLGCTGKTNATVIFYGENPNPIEKIKNVNGPVMGLYGGEDTRINSKVDELVKALVAYKKHFTIRVFPGAYHAFFNNTRQQTYNESAAKEAWEMVLKFYKENL